MTNTIKLNHKEKLIVMDRTFAKLAENPRSDEYQLLQSVKRDYPDYKVVRKTIKKNASKETYKGLTYNYMRRYISNHETKKEAATIIAELEELIEISRCHAQSKRYPVIKKWFLEKYPEIAKFGMPEAKEEKEPEDEKDNEESEVEFEVVEENEIAEVEKPAA